MIQIYNALVAESETGAMSSMTAIIKQHTTDIKLNICQQWTEDCIDDIDFVFVQIAKKEDLILVRKMIDRNCRIIAVISNHEFFKDIIAYDISAFILSDSDIPQILKAINKVKTQLNFEMMGLRIDSVLHMQYPRRSGAVIIPTREGFEVVRVNDILQVQADRAYCILYLINGKKMIVSKPLREIEELLPQEIFFRSHHSHLININAVMCYRRDDGGCLILSDSSKVPIAKKRKDELLDVLTIR